MRKRFRRVCCMTSARDLTVAAPPGTPTRRRQRQESLPNWRDWTHARSDISVSQRSQGLLDLARHGATTAEDPGEAGQGVAERGQDVRVAEPVCGDAGGPPQGGGERPAQPERP